MFDRGSGAAVRVRVRARRDVCGARVSAAAAIGRAELHPPALPPSAILCVRWMRVAESIGAPHDLAARRRFERALQLTVAELARGALRPADGPISRCDAVLFDDLAELLACLARDWVDGRAADRWWWRTLLRARASLELVTNTWADAGPHIAPAFQRLAASGGAAAFASALDARQVRLLAAATSLAHGGPSVTDLLIRRAPDQPMAPAHVPAGTGRMSTIADAVTSLARRYGAASSSTPLRYDQCALVALAAVARHSQRLLQQTRFVDAFHAALDSMRSEAKTPLVDTSLTGRDRRRDERHGVRDTTAAIPPSPSEAPELLRRHEHVQLQGAYCGDPAPDPAETIACHIDSGIAADGASQVSEASPSTCPSTAVVSPVAPFTDTPLGGVFYLLNVAIALRLYGDFTMPRRRGLPLSPWDFLALAAEQWLGEPLDAATASLLARLAGHAPGGRPGDRLFRRDRLARWVPRLVCRINRRVACALGEPAEGATARRLLCHPARVYVTEAHVDVMFDLESLPVDIRLAGLDRNPGWIPSAGRIVTLHYS